MVHFCWFVQTSCKQEQYQIFVSGIVQWPGAARSVCRARRDGMFHCRVFAAKKLQTTEHLRVLPQNPLRKRKELQNEHGRLFELKVFLTGACKSTHAPELPSVLSFILSLQVQISCTRFGSCRRRCYSTRPIASTDSARVVANVLKYFAFTFHFSTLFFVEFSQRPH